MTCATPACGNPATYRSTRVDLVAVFCARCVALALDKGIDAAFFVTLRAAGAA